MYCIRHHVPLLPDGLIFTGQRVVLDTDFGRVDLPPVANTTSFNASGDYVEFYYEMVFAGLNNSAWGGSLPHAANSSLHAPPSLSHELPPVWTGKFHASLAAAAAGQNTPWRGVLSLNLPRIAHDDGRASL